MDKNAGNNMYKINKINNTLPQGEVDDRYLRHFDQHLARAEDDLKHGRYATFGEFKDELGTLYGKNNFR